jgi:carbonic anhydrase
MRNLFGIIMAFLLLAFACSAVAQQHAVPTKHTAAKTMTAPKESVTTKVQTSAKEHATPESHTTAAEPAASGGHTTGGTISIPEAENKLKEGNERFCANTMLYANQNMARLKELAAGQYPYAVVVSCSDSRLPVEQIFDAGFGDIFVIRVAGNICDVNQIASVEYAVGHLGAPIVVVLGHTKCGAVTAACTKADAKGSIASLVEKISPAVDKAQGKHSDLFGESLVPFAIEENIWQAISDLYNNSESTRELVRSGRIKIIGAEYDIESGKVKWLGPSPEEKALVGVAEQNPVVGTTDGDDAVKFLFEGNKRFMSGNSNHPHKGAERMQETAKGQHPRAIVLSCSDSRVPPEWIFDAGIGDIFIIRVAGNVCNADEVGSIEYAAEHLHTPLMVVMGHSSCGAVKAAVSGAKLEGSLPSLIENIRPAVSMAKSLMPDQPENKLVDLAARENVWQSIEDLFKRSPEVCELVQTGSLKVVGAMYHLSDGQVEWFGSHPKETALLSTGPTTTHANFDEEVIEEKPTSEMSNVKE